MTTVITPKLRLLRQYLPVVLVLSLFAATPAAYGDDMAASDDLADFSLEELLSTEITTLSRKAESLVSAPAAVHVVSQSDIRRSGARSIPELLRLVPGMQVAQLDGNKWAVTARGNNGRFAPRLLVLMDGRTLYNPMLSGVQWDAQDTDISAIERIEVIRGPGATMWGSNAVNGVVNIITKHAADTQGGNLGVSGGMQGYETTFRYGAVNGDSSIRLFGKYFDRDGNTSELGFDTDDYSEMARFGGRYDWDGSETSTFTMTFELYDGESGEYRLSRTLTPPYQSVVDTFTPVSGAFAMGHWSKDLGDESAFEIRAYYDTHERDTYTYTEDIETFDVDIQHSFPIGNIHNFMWGLNYRSSTDETTSTFEISILPANENLHRYSAFVQDEISLLDGRARLMVGSKFEHNEFSDDDLEIEPSVRLSFNISDNQAIWASVSEAVRVPSRGERGGNVLSAVVPPGADPTFPVPVPTAVYLSGNPAMTSEDFTSYEAGYRMRTQDLHLDIALFYVANRNLRDIAAGAPICQPGGGNPILDPTCLFTSTYVEVPLVLNNGGEQDTMGVELFVSRQMSERWRLQGGYTYFRYADVNYNLTDALEFPEDSPDHQVSLRSSTDINENFELDVMFRWVDELESQGVDAYGAVDVRAAWTPMPGLSIAAVGRNLFADDHLEFTSELADLLPVLIEPEAFVEVRWGF